MILLEISTFGAFFYAGAGILVFVVITKLFKKKTPENKFEELPRDKWISRLANSKDYEEKLIISKKIVHDRTSSKIELEEVLIRLEHGSFKYYEEDPAEIAKNRLIRMKYDQLHRKKIERERVEKKEKKNLKKAKIIQRKQILVNFLVSFFKSEKTKKVEK